MVELSKMKEILTKMIKKLTKMQTQKGNGDGIGFQNLFCHH